MLRESGKGAKRKGRERKKEERCLGGRRRWRGGRTVKVSARPLHSYWLIPVVFVFAEPGRLGFAGFSPPPPHKVHPSRRRGPAPSSLPFAQFLASPPSRLHGNEVRASTPVGSKEVGGGRGGAAPRLSLSLP